MGRLRREVGFWGSVGRLHLSDLFTIEIGGGIVLGVAASVVLVREVDLTARQGLAGDYLALTPALLGVVFAALALVVALMSDAYMRHLRTATGGVLAFLGPFMLVIGLQVGTLLLTVGYRAFSAELPTEAEHWFFGVVTTLFAVSSLEVVALARSVLMHGLARSRFEEVANLDTARQRKTG